jgi:transketolase
MSVLSAPTAQYDCRKAYAETLVELMAADQRIVVVVNDSVGSSNLAEVAARFPDRVVNVGIAEQDMVGVAAGLAAGGRIPFVSAAACFLTARAAEQIKVDLGYARGNVKLCGQAPGMAYGELGPTHHSIEDISWLRAVAGMAIVVPADPIETAAAVRWAAAYDGPVFLRISRMKVPQVFDDDHRFAFGRAATLREGEDVAIIANGTALHRALDAADLLDAQGIQARVVAMTTVKPLDKAAIARCAETRAGIITVEEATVSGGLGAGVASEVVHYRRPVPMRIIGVPDVFAPTGSEAWLMNRFGISAEGIVAAARELLEGVPG